MPGPSFQELRLLSTSDWLGELEMRLLCHVGGQVRDLQLVASDTGLILRGHTPTYYARHLTQKFLEEIGLPVLANEIVVS